MTAKDELPPIPEKRYFSIGEVSELCLVKPHVLRYWEQEFRQLKPSKRRGNRRYYQHKDVLVIRNIRSLLYDQGFTIGGARQKLVNDGDSNNDVIAAEHIPSNSTDLNSVLHATITDLESCLNLLEQS